ncbi:MAG: hypothetical protein AAGF94_19990 [Pseudomonadota bacterium]
MLWSRAVPALQNGLHLRYGTKMEHSAPNSRTKPFLSKATPGDDAYAFWPALRLKAEG